MVRNIFQIRANAAAFGKRLFTIPKIIALAFLSGALFAGQLILTVITDTFKDKAEALSATWAASQFNRPLVKKAMAWCVATSIKYPTASVAAVFFTIILVLVLIALLQERGNISERSIQQRVDSHIRGSGPGENRRAPEPRVISELPLLGKVYIGRTEIELEHLSKDCYFTIRLYGFNGANAGFEFTQAVDGSIIYKHISSQGVNHRRLPAPPILKVDAPLNLKPAQYSEFWIDLEQRVPSELVSTMLEGVGSTQTLELGFEQLNVWVRFKNHSTNDKQRLPMWHGISCQKFGNKVLVGKINIMSFGP